MSDPDTSYPTSSDEPPLVAGSTGTAALLSGPDEAQAFWRMRRRVVATLVRQTFSDAWFRLSVIAGLSLLLWGGLFWLFFDGFVFLRTAIPSADWHDQTIRTVFGMFFMALSAMLIFSSGIILYSSLFRGPDVGLLLTIPARAERIFLHKFQEAILLSSWAFLLLGSPMVLAYGLVVDAPWYYFVMLVPLLLAFTYIPAALGSILCLVIVRYLPRGRVLLLAVTALLILAVGAWVGWSLIKSVRVNMMTPTWFQDLLDRLRITEQRWLPGWWLSSGLMEAGRRVWTESMLFLVLLISNALFFRQLAIWTAARLYRTGYSRLHSERSPRKQTRVSWIDRAVGRATSILPTQVRLLIVKDLRLFRRDPVQWSQFLIFIGLLVLYFLNIRSFRYDTFYAGWVNMVSFLNLSVVGLLLSTFTTRFIFPMVSLEGRRFWILGLLPLRRDTILWGKFLFAICGSVIPCSGLILLSDVMLRVRAPIVVWHQITCLVLCFGLSGIAVGLGAKMPNLREQSPSRIAAGFGGTLNLVLSTLFIAVVVVLSALPCHFFFGADSSRIFRWVADRENLMAWLRLWLIGGTGLAILLGAAATIVPMRIGFRAFRRLEF